MYNVKYMKTHLLLTGNFFYRMLKTRRYVLLEKIYSLKTKDMGRLKSFKNLFKKEIDIFFLFSYLKNGVVYREEREGRNINKY